MAGWTEAAWCWGPRASRQQEWELGRGGKGGSQWYIQMLTDPEAGEGTRKPRDPGGGVRAQDPEGQVCQGCGSEWNPWKECGV